MLTKVMANFATVLFGNVKISVNRSWWHAELIENRLIVHLDVILSI